MLRKEKAGRRRRRRRLPIVAGLLLLALLGVGLIVLRVQFNGAALAELVEDQMNRRMRGHVEIESIEWPMSSLPSVVTGGFIEVEIKGLKVFDSEEDGKDAVLIAPYATAELDAHPAMLGRHDLIIRNIKVKKDGDKGGYALIKEIKNPYPVHEYDTSTVSLTAAFYPKHVAAFRAGISAGSSPIFDLRDYQIDDATLDFKFSNFTAHVEGATLDSKNKGFLRFDGSDPLARSLYFALRPTAKSGWIQFGPKKIDLTNIVVTRLAQLPTQWPHDSVPHGLEYSATATTVEGAQVKLDGVLNRTWLDLFGGEHDLKLTVTEAGGLAHRLSGGRADGKNMNVALSLQGPVLGPKTTLNLSNVDLTVATMPDRPTLALHLERATAVFDQATDSGYLEDTVATGAGGEVHLAASLNLAPTSFDLSVEIPRALELGPYLPPNVRKLLGSQLSGGLHAFGNTQVQRLDQLDLKLGRARVTGGAFRTADGRIHAQEPRGLEVAVGKTRVKRITGVIDHRAGKLVGVKFNLESTDTALWLAKVGAPPLARGVTGSGHVEGPLASPRGGASLTVTGVPVVQRVETDLRYQDRQVMIESARSSALGGSLTASGKLVLGRRPELVDVQAHGEGLDLSRLPGSAGLIKGKVSVDATASGAAAAPRATASAKVTGLVLAGDEFQDTDIRFDGHPDGRKNLAFELARKSGGVLAADAVFGRHGELGGAISLRKLPLETLTALGGKGKTPLGGRIDAELQMSGTLAAPTADGRIQIARGWFRDTFLGSAQLDVERVGNGQLRVSGQLFQGKVEVDGVVSTRAPFRADMTVVLRRVEIDHLLPELAQKYEVRGWLSGEIRWKGALSMAPGMRPEVSAIFTEAVVIRDGEDAAGRPAPIRLANLTPLEMAFDGRTVELKKSVVLRGPAGDFRLSGKGGLDGLAFALDGKVSISMLAPYLKRYFDSMSGELDIAVRVTGTPEAPRFAGTVQLSKIALKPVGQDAMVRIPGGKIEVANDQLAVTGLSMVVVDEFSDDRSELRVSGGVGLKNFRPVHWGLDISGELSGKMLLVVAPTVFTAASGSAELSISLMGEGRTPDINGQLRFDETTPLTLIPRGLRREIAMTGGKLLFTDKLIEFVADEDDRGNLIPVSGWVDDEGEIAELTGEISLENWKPVDIDLSVTANDLPFRVPQTLELAVNVNRLRVRGGMGTGLAVSGLVEIVDGRYVKKFQPALDALRPERSRETSIPVWEAVPLVGNARLDLQVATRAFFVKNNVADIEMNGEVKVTGTPLRPRLEGVIRVEQGSFKFQGVRARFTQTRGTVNFSPYRSFPEFTPTLDIRSESEYRDISGQTHLITLSLRGPIGQLDWDLATNTGLNKAQTFTLIFIGRSPDEARRALGDEAIGTTGANTSTAGTGTSSGSLVVADQLLKQLAGEYFSLLMEDSIKGVTKLDVVRIELGTSSLGTHIEKEFVPSLRGKADVERSLRGWSWDARGEYRLNDTVSAEAGASAKNFDDASEEDESEGRAELIWRRVFLP